MTSTFADLGVPPALVAVLDREGIRAPFPIQAASIPDLLAGRDVVGRAQTGSGKTLAFGIPLVAAVDRAEARRPHALILAPTRELAEQIAGDLTPLATAADRRVLAVYGGVGIEPQIAKLRRGIDILVATPGRLEDLMARGAVTLDAVRTVVLDEADRMADMGFMPAVKRILGATSRPRQTVLFSATLDGDVGTLIAREQHDPVRHEVGPAAPDLDAMEHHFWELPRAERVPLCASVIATFGRTIVFTRTRHGADRLAKQLNRVGVGAVAIHGNRSQAQRTRALADFTEGRAHALVATDVAARGIHVDDVACVVHYDPVDEDSAYVHRSGRTARAGARGRVVSFVDPQQTRLVRAMLRRLGLHAEITPPPEVDGTPLPVPADDRTPDGAGAGRDTNAGRRSGAGRGTSGAKSTGTRKRQNTSGAKSSGKGKGKGKGGGKGRGAGKPRRGGTGATTTSGARRRSDRARRPGGR